MKYYTDPDELFYDIVPECNSDKDAYPQCTSEKTGDFAKLNVSLVSGCFIQVFSLKLTNYADRL